MNVRFAANNDKHAVLMLWNQLGKIINDQVSSDSKNEQAHIYGSDNYDYVMERNDVKIFVLEDKGILVGAASFFILHDMITGTPFAHIDDFVIDQAYRGMGYGTFLMKKILIYAKKKKISPIKVTSSLPLTEAHAFYEKLGGIFAQKVIKFTTT